MKKTAWAAALSSAILGLSCIGTIARADSATQPAQRGPDSAGTYSASALYNLGNSYARQGKTALAVLNYERARLLAPRDADIRSNLRHEQESASLPAKPTLVERFQILSPDAAYWVGFTGLMIAGVSGLLLAAGKSARAAWSATLAAGVFMTLFTVGNISATARLMHEAVVLQSASASASPIGNAEALFMLPPATLVQIEDEHGNFTLIRDSQGQVGWVPRERITKVVDAIGSSNG